MRYQCEQGHRIQHDRQRTLCYKEILFSYFKKMTGSPGGFEFTVQSEGLFALLRVCLAMRPCVFVPEGVGCPLITLEAVP